MTAWRFLLLLIGIMGIISPDYVWANDAHPGKKVFQRCAACHLADGAGVPGAFPPLGESVVKMSETEGGREYLTYVVLKGVSGKIEVDGQAYNGLMPGVAAGLSDEQISDLLNYMIAVVASDEKTAVDIKPDDGVAKSALFSPNEIKAFREFAVGDHTLQSILSLRLKALEEALVSLPDAAQNLTAAEQ